MCEYTQERRDELIQEIRDLVKLYPDSYARMVTSRTREYLLDFVKAMTPLLNDPKYLISTRCYWILNGLTDFPKCPECGKPLMYNVKVNRGYGTFCSKKCKNASDIPVKKGRETRRIRYGSETYNNVAKSRATCLVRYGVTNPNKTDIVRAKIKQTCLERFGVEHNFMSPRCRAKREQTWLSKYGTSNPKATKKVQEKYERTCLEKYGTHNVSQSEEVKETKRKTFQRRYGSDCYLSSAEGRRAITETFLRKYGVKAPAQCPDVNRRIKRRYLYKGIRFASSWELAIYIYLVDNNRDFEYQPSISIKYQACGKEHYYLPDFLIDGTLYEVKGDQFVNQDGTWRDIYGRNEDAKAEAKRQACLRNGVRILYKKDVKKFLEYVKRTYGSGYLDSFRCPCKQSRPLNMVRKENRK